MRLPFSWSAGPVNARRQLPPYLPISSSGLMTNSCDGSGRRLSTAGSLPALTSSASAGASLKVFGNALASRMISGPWSLPISDEPIFGAPAAPPPARPPPLTPSPRCRRAQDPPAHVLRASVSYESPFLTFRYGHQEIPRTGARASVRQRRRAPAQRQRTPRAQTPPFWGILHRYRRHCLPQIKSASGEGSRRRRRCASPARPECGRKRVPVADGGPARSLLTPSGPCRTSTH